MCTTGAHWEQGLLLNRRRNRITVVVSLRRPSVFTSACRKQILSKILTRACKRHVHLWWCWKTNDQPKSQSSGYPRFSERVLTSAHCRKPQIRAAPWRSVAGPPAAKATCLKRLASDCPYNETKYSAAEADLSRVDMPVQKSLAYAACVIEKQLSRCRS